AAHCTKSFRRTTIRVQVILPGATATGFFDIAGIHSQEVPSESVMNDDEMVDAARRCPARPTLIPGLLVIVKACLLDTRDDLACVRFDTIDFLGPQPGAKRYSKVLGQETQGLLEFGLVLITWDAGNTICC